MGTCSFLSGFPSFFVTGLLFATACSESRVSKEQNARVVLSFPDHKTLSLSSQDFVPFLYGIHIQGPDGFVFRKQLRSAEVVELEIPAGSTNIRTVYATFQIPVGTEASDITKVICPSNDSEPETATTAPTTANDSLKLSDDGRTDAEVWASEINSKVETVAGEVVNLEFPSLRKVPMVPFGINLQGRESFAGLKVEFVDPVSGELIRPPADLCATNEAYFENIDKTKNWPFLSSWPLILSDGSMSFRFVDSTETILGHFATQISTSETTSVDWLKNIFNLDFAVVPPILLPAKENDDFDSDGIANIEELRVGTNPFRKDVLSSDIQLSTAYNSERFPVAWMSIQPTVDRHAAVECSVNDGPVQKCFGEDNNVAGFCLVGEGICQPAAAGTYRLSVKLVDKWGFTYKVNKDFDWTPYLTDVSISPQLNTVSNSTQFSISGYAERTSTVTILVGDLSVSSMGGLNGHFSANLDLHSLRDGTYPVTVTVTSTIGSTTHSLGAYQLDRRRPIVSISPPSTIIGKRDTVFSYTISYFGASSIDLRASDVSLQTAGNVTCVTPVTLTGGQTLTPVVSVSQCNGDGTVGISVAPGRATNAVGNTDVGGLSQTAIVDNTAPLPMIMVPSNGDSLNSVGPLSVTGACESELNVIISGMGVRTATSVPCLRGKFSASINLESGEGSKIISASQSDAAGNIGSSAEVTVNLDTTPPVVTVTSPTPNAATQSPITFFGTCEANLPVFFGGAGVLNAPQMTGCDAGVYSFDVVLTGGDGNKVVEVEQIDVSGNVSAPMSVSVRRDNTPPDLTISAPSASIVNSSDSVNFTVSFYDTGGSGIQSVNMSDSQHITLHATGTASCAATIAGTGTLSRTVTLSSCIGDGTIAITVAPGVAIDVAGNSSLAAGPGATFTVNNTGPVPTIITPPVAAYLNSTNNVIVSGSCESGLDVGIGGSGVQTSATVPCVGGGFSSNITLTSGDGSKIISASQTDTAGNTGISGDVTVFLDTVAPSIVVTYPAVNAVINNTNANLVISGSCESALTVNLSGDVPAGQTSLCSGGSFSFSAWQVNASDGNKTVIASQTDAAGNFGSSTINLVLDTISVSAPLIDESARPPIGLHGVLQGTCDSGLGNETTAMTNIGRVKSVSCVANALTILVTDLPEGRQNLSVTTTTTRPANGLSQSQTQSFLQQFFCPKGYVGVPGKFVGDSDTEGLGNASATADHADAGLDPTRDFCVMKYTAKVATSNYAGQQPWEPVYDGKRSFSIGNYWPDSRPSGTSWTHINRDQAADRCKALNEASLLCTGTYCYSSFDNSNHGFRLITNTQWQVLARNLESTGGNWTSGTSWVGYLWRGNSDSGIDSNANLHSFAFGSGILSNPRSDGSSDYFGTNNSHTQNTSSTSGWQERRRFVLSTGSSVWDFAGNIWEWVSDTRTALGIPSVEESAINTSGGVSYLSDGSNRWSDTVNLLFGSMGIGGIQLSEALNAGMFLGGPGSGIIRGGGYLQASGSGIFTANINNDSTFSDFDVGFRCTYLPAKEIASDTNPPVIGSIYRSDVWGNDTGSNTAISISNGGIWHLGWTVTDAETSQSLLFIEVRRKITNSSADFPTLADEIYKKGFRLTSLKDETAWVLDKSTGRYFRNDGKYVNYLITAIEANGNIDFKTFSVEVMQSCPPGFVGVPGGNTTTGLGHVQASVGNTDKQLDPSLAFCIMKHPAKVMSAGTTAAHNNVGGKFEHILNGNKIFTNDYTYADNATFDAKVKYLPESRPDGTPWVNINRDNGINACRALQMQYFGTMTNTAIGNGFQLVSNTQWQTVARNLASTNTNWSNNTVGSGVLNRGHTDTASHGMAITNSWNMGGSIALPGSVSDANSYFGTGNGASDSWHLLGISPAAGTEQKRTFDLSNGSVLWDMAGNVWQWVKDNNSDGSGLGGDIGVSTKLRTAANWWELDNADVTASDKLLFGSAGGYTSAKNAGKVYGSSAGAVIRGGNWNDSTQSGLFAAFLNYGPQVSYNSIGFRCVFVP